MVFEAILDDKKPKLLIQALKVHLLLFERIDLHLENTVHSAPV